MSILPFVMTFILVLSLYAASLFKTHTHFVFEKEIYLSQYEGDLKLRNSLITDDYEATKKRETKPPKNPQKVIRPIDNFPDRSKLNLSHLNNPAILKTAVALVKQLYKKAPFEFNPEELFKEAKEKMKTTNDFSEIFPYKMVKGTLGNYPPLSDYFYINPKRPAIYFRHASKPVITAYFGEKISAQIFELEKESTLTEEELLPLSSKKEGLIFTKTRDTGKKKAYRTPLTQVERKKKSK